MAEAAIAGATRRRRPELIVGRQVGFIGRLEAGSQVPSALAGYLARELHDGVAQDLATLLIRLENFRVEQAGRQGVQDEIHSMQDRIRQVLVNVRGLLYDQRGMPGVERDFVGTIRGGLVKRFAERTRLTVKLSASRQWPSELPSETAMNLYRIIQEALNNVERHSGARRVWVRLELNPDGAGIMKISDDGRGMASNASWSVGLGLLGIKERALLLGAHATVLNRRGGGCTVRVEVPGRKLRA